LGAAFKAGDEQAPAGYRDHHAATREQAEVRHVRSGWMGGAGRIAVLKTLQAPPSRCRSGSAGTAEVRNYMTHIKTWDPIELLNTHLYSALRQRDESLVSEIEEQLREAYARRDMPAYDRVRHAILAYESAYRQVFREEVAPRLADILTQEAGDDAALRIAQRLETELLDAGFSLDGRY